MRFIYEEKVCDLLHGPIVRPLLVFQVRSYLYDLMSYFERYKREQPLHTCKARTKNQGIHYVDFAIQKILQSTRFTLEQPQKLKKGVGSVTLTPKPHHTEMAKKK